MSVSPSLAPPLGLGLDAGGTQTRWALADAAGRTVAQGHVAGLSGLQLAGTQGRVALAQTAHQLAFAVLPHGRPAGLYAGVTGVGEANGPAALQLKDILSQALGLQPARMFVGSDMDIAYRSAFAPGEGYLLYAGTGAIAAFIDAEGRMQRAGGRGALLGDEGSGFWIAREALALVWRREDEAPGAWRESALARRLFEALGGADWAQTRTFVYAGERGAMGRLALAVAAAAEADADPDARALLQRAGAELARLALALLKRYGARPVVAAGRALQLHPLIPQGLRAALPTGTALTVTHLEPHLTAAQLAARL
ncbi:ATPase [Roseateles sp. DAIF2]|uniref:N-acetylglucosamine kinase n=1 Tax=Roseateles sp. DAIF2 TaxID=2714952 RepID=UPI0018A32317|nr:BadF/BadG/BcrA/BcrD ATPase family protein [Roseateles sp. DAIF2]QPF71802.1 ATPase [Roseateles sp. DAIF2]